MNELTLFRLRIKNDFLRKIIIVGNTTNFRRKFKKTTYSRTAILLNLKKKRLWPYGYTINLKKIMKHVI